MKDFGIVHLTDLHYPLHGPAKWQGTFMHAIGRVPDDSLEIRGMAVTGDLVDSPSSAGFENASVFLDDVAGALKLPGATKEERRTRIWIIDGNHDYRILGNIRVSWKGVTAGGHLARLATYFDEDAGLFLVGLNSCGTGQLARGGVKLKELEHVVDLIALPLLAAASFSFIIICSRCQPGQLNT